MLNRIDIAGRLTADPELRHTQSGTSVCSFTIAVDRDFKNQNGEKETDWIPVVAWKNTAEFAARYFKKGDMAIVSGRLQSRRWEDKAGTKRTSYDVVADSIYFAGSKKTFEQNLDQLEKDIGKFQDLGDTNDGELPF